MSKTTRDLVQAAGGEKTFHLRGRTFNVSLPLDIRKQMANYPGVNWSGVARKALTDLLDQLESAEYRVG